MAPDTPVAQSIGSRADAPPPWLAPSTPDGTSHGCVPVKRFPMGRATAVSRPKCSRWDGPPP